MRIKTQTNWIINAIKINKIPQIWFWFFFFFIAVVITFELTFDGFKRISPLVVAGRIRLWDNSIYISLLHILIRKGWKTQFLISR